MQMYDFVTEWEFAAPIEAVWQELADFRAFPRWWPDWRKLELRDGESEPGVGSVFDCEVRGSLPYSLRYSLEITRQDPPFLNEHASTGDLVGHGKWVLRENEKGTVVQHHWHVGTSNPFLNALSYLPFVKSMMAQNHSEVMARGYQGLKARLEQ